MFVICVWTRFVRVFVCVCARVRVRRWKHPHIPWTLGYGC